MHLFSDAKGKTFSVHLQHDTRSRSVLLQIYCGIEIPANAIHIRKQFCLHADHVLESAFKLNVQLGLGVMDEEKMPAPLSFDLSPLLVLSITES